MAVKIRLMRVGKTKQPTYRVVVADSRSPRDGRIIETIGHYGPRHDPSVINGSRRVRIASGAGVTPADVNALLKQFKTVQQMMKGMTGGKRGRFKLPPGMDMADLEGLQQQQ